MSDDTTPLLPCPFCGNDAAAIDDFVTFHVECASCGSTGPISSYKRGAAKLWNRRVPCQPVGSDEVPEPESEDKGTPC